MAVILMNDFKREYREICGEIRQAVERVLESGWYILGNEVSNFEQKFAAYIGRKYAVGVNSGTDALLISLLAAGVKQGDEVVTVSHTTTPTVMPVLLLGAKPRFVDVKEDTYTIDPTKIEKVLSEKTKVLMPVHLYGQPCVLDVLQEICEAKGIVLVEDCCQAHGASFKGKKVGSWGEFGAFSFYPTKNIGAYGDGGIILTDDEELYQKMVEIRQYGWRERYNSYRVGVNSRLDEIQAAILTVKLKYLDEWNERRRKNAKIYSEELEGYVKLPVEEKFGYHVYHQFVIRHGKRDTLRAYLQKNGVQTQIHYPVPVHKQELFCNLGYGKLELPVTEKIAKEIISLPVHPFLSEEDICHVADLIKRFEE